MDVSIVIPTKNGGSQLRDVLKAIFSQQTTLTYEVICVDSGSKDNTLEIIREFPDARLYEIPPEEFGHGKTRNYGASKGAGDYIVFITQDALPANEKWLESLVNTVSADPLCAGAFGIHYPYPDCNLFDKRDLEIHFRGFGMSNTYYWITDWNRYRNEEGYRHMLAFYSDNNSCMRRSIWEKYPYDDVDFAEDQIWARKMIELGYHKAFAADAAVYHSHNYKLSSFAGRFFDEFRSLYQLHHYIIVPSVGLVLPGAIKHIISDFSYVKQCKDQLSFKERGYWRYYAFVKNCCRYICGWLGGNYHRYSPRKQAWLDKHLSQQYKQRNK